jgi:2-iminobutanoate/2-iminopropanoate deaminase
MKFLLVPFIFLLATCRQPAENDAIHTDKAAQPIAPYSQAIRAGNTLYIAGQIALRADGTLDTSSIENECSRILDNIRQILAEAGMQPDNLVKCSIYLTDLKDFKAINNVYAKFFVTRAPARETVQVAALPKGAHIEISAIAYKDQFR